MLPHSFCSRSSGTIRRRSNPRQQRSRYAVCILLSAWLYALMACTAQTSLSPESAATPTLHLGTPVDPIKLLNRVTWGSNSAGMQQLTALGAERFLANQLRPGKSGGLPAPIQAQIEAMTITQQPMEQLVGELEQRRQDAEALSSETDKATALQAYQQELTRLAREAATRMLLRALYAPTQLHEHMVWFWLNHFSVFQQKKNIRAMLGDYEAQAIRPHALGRFRDLLAATVRHPAMLRYLDNDQNAVGRVNENYARELLELHTLGLNGGYTQRDVQELARVLTGLGVYREGRGTSMRQDWQNQHVRQGLFEFQPQRHDYGAKVFLEQPVKGRGLAEIDEVIERLSRHPATAHFISRKLALYLLSDTPPESVIKQMAQTFRRQDGDIAATLRTLFASPVFAQSLGGKFKDPLHYVVSAVRLTYDDTFIVNAGPLLTWLQRMGQPLYGRQTPDGYPLTEEAWNSPGQMTTRFEIARVIGSGSPGLFRSDAAPAAGPPTLPNLARTPYYQALQPTLSPATRQALAQAGSTSEWNTFFLASPAFMYR